MKTHLDSKLPLLQDADVENKIVLLRVDHNVVKKGVIEDPEVSDTLSPARTIFVNAVMGYTPYFNEGSAALDSKIDQNEAANKLYGGGDTRQFIIPREARKNLFIY